MTRMTFLRQIYFKVIDSVIIKKNPNGRHIAVYEPINFKRRIVFLDRYKYYADRDRIFSMDEFIKALKEKKIETEIKLMS